MRKRLVLGDFHSRIEVFKTIYETENPDDVIILGDYVDPHEPISDSQQKAALEELLRIKSEHTKGEFILLFGNHDFHYYYDNPWIERYSGYSYARAKWATSLYKELLNKGILQTIYIDETNKTIYSHAGITNTWLSMYNIDVHKINHYMLNNDIFSDDFVENSNKIFCFSSNGRFSSGTGDTKDNSCIWVRPYSLIEDVYKEYKHIVGHTPVEIISAIKDGELTINLLDFDIILADNLPKNYIVEFLDENNIVVERKINSPRIP